MLHRILPIIAIILLGQGCLPPQRSAVVSEPEIITGEPSPEGAVPFYNGFGPLPGRVPFPTDLPDAVLPTVILNTELPAIPPNVTVLREWNRATDDILLRNITTALDVPIGALGQDPTGQSLSVNWQDMEGHQWTYQAPTPRLLFARGTREVLPEAEAFPSPEDATITVNAFLRDHGVNTVGWGVPQAYPSYGEDGAMSGTTVAFAASRDEQPAMIETGHSFPAAEFQLDKVGIREAFMALPVRLDRSNYPSITSGEVLTRLRMGGTSPLFNTSPATVITITDFSMVLYRHLGADGRIYYLPSLRAEGTVRNGNRQDSYITLIPLIQDSAFLEFK
ncbi:MAG: hypothetical protein RL141_743 [Candidatus Parcubacteria bacterium]|jgi:hypothetical protein